MTSSADYKNSAIGQKKNKMGEKKQDGCIFKNRHHKVVMNIVTRIKGTKHGIRAKKAPVFKTSTGVVKVTLVW